MRPSCIVSLLILLVQNQSCQAEVYQLRSQSTSSASELSTRVDRLSRNAQVATRGEKVLGIQAADLYHRHQITQVTPAEEPQNQEDAVPEHVIQQSEALKKKWTELQHDLAVTEGEDKELPPDASYRNRGAWEWFIQEAYINKSGKEMVTVSLVTGFSDENHDVAWEEVSGKHMPGLSSEEVNNILREKKKEWRTHQEKMSPKQKEQRTQRKNQGFVNLALGDGGPGCRVKSNARNHLYFYHPILDSTFPEIQESFLYEITTPWKLAYPRQLRKALIAMGFKMVSAPMECSPKYTWSHLFNVEAAAVYRGSVDMKFPRGSSARNISLYDDQWEMIEDVLEETFPHLEITMIILGSFGLVAFLGLGGRWMTKRCGWGVGKKTYASHSKKTQSLEDDCVELRDTQAHVSGDTAYPDLP